MPGQDPARKENSQRRTFRRPVVEQYISEMGRSTAGTITFGIGESDYAPITLNLYKKRRANLRIVGDPGSGRTHLLQVMARSAVSAHDSKVGWGVLTNHPEQWRGLTSLRGGLGIQDFSDLGLIRLLASFKNWYETDIKSPGGEPKPKPGLFLIDGLELIEGLSLHYQQTLKHIITKGAPSLLWPISTEQTVNSQALNKLLQVQSTKIYGKSQRYRTLKSFEKDQFVMFDERLRDVVKFWSLL